MFCEMSWSPPAWTSGQAGTAQRTTDLRTVVQQVVNRAGWNPGNALAFVLTGTGERRASSHDGSAPPVLHLAYTPAGGGGNTPPTAAFTSSCTELQCSFNGSGSSDPEGPIASYQWNFGDNTATSTSSAPSHTYAADGTYVITLITTGPCPVNWTRPARTRSRRWPAA